MTGTNDDRDPELVAHSTRYRRWCTHLEDRGSTLPDVDDFLTFGCLSTLERLRTELSRIAPEHCGPLARAIAHLKREKTARAGSQAKGGQKGPVCRLLPINCQLTGRRPSPKCEGGVRRSTPG
jgi:hypothetical protein